VLRQQVFAFDARGSGPFASSPLAPEQHQPAQSKAAAGGGMGGGMGGGGMGGGVGGGGMGGGGGISVLRYPVQSVGRVTSAHDSSNNSGKR
jgi:hypothetical protein